MATEAKECYNSLPVQHVHGLQFRKNIFQRLLVFLYLLLGRIHDTVFLPRTAWVWSYEFACNFTISFDRIYLCCIKEMPLPNQAQPAPKHEFTCAAMLYSVPLGQRFVVPKWTDPAQRISGRTEEMYRSLTHLGHQSLFCFVHRSLSFTRPQLSRRPTTYRCRTYSPPGVLDVNVRW